MKHHTEGWSAMQKLWTKAVGTPGYDKSEWQQLERIVENLYAFEGEVEKRLDDLERLDELAKRCTDVENSNERNREQIVVMENRLTGLHAAIADVVFQEGGNERTRKDATDLKNRLRSVRNVADNLRSRLELAQGDSRAPGERCRDAWVIQAKTIVADLDAILGKS